MCAQHLPSCCPSRFSGLLSPLSNLDTRMVTRYQDKLRQELNNEEGEFPGSPVIIRLCPSNEGGVGSILGQGTKIQCVLVV